MPTNEELTEDGALAGIARILVDQAEQELLKRDVESSVRSTDNDQQRTA